MSIKMSTENMPYAFSEDMFKSATPAEQERSARFLAAYAQAEKEAEDENRYIMVYAGSGGLLHSKLGVLILSWYNTSTHDAAWQVFADLGAEVRELNSEGWSIGCTKFDRR